MSVDRTWCVRACVRWGARSQGEVQFFCRRNCRTRVPSRGTEVLAIYQSQCQEVSDHSVFNQEKKNRFNLDELLGQLGSAGTSVSIQIFAGQHFHSQTATSNSATEFHKIIDQAGCIHCAYSDLLCNWNLWQRVLSRCLNFFCYSHLKWLMMGHEKQVPLNVSKVQRVA